MKRSPQWCAIAFILFPVVSVAADIERTEFRKPRNDEDLKYWLWNMRDLHDFNTAEMMVATGLTRNEIEASIARLLPTTPPTRDAQAAKLLVVPYPGGRHPRLGFRDGAIRPQRETKVSVFAPWNDGGYVVVDVPEAIWCDRGLLYLAHTHVPTIWDKQQIVLEKREWIRRADGGLDVDRTLPNGVVFGARVVPHGDHVEMTMRLSNGSDRPLSDLRVQMCAMLAALHGFEAQTNDNKVFDPPYAACKSRDRNRWVLIAWEPAHRVWGNPPCPCLHSDPKFPDCLPGQTRTLRGWLSFYEGSDIKAEFQRIDATGWRKSD